MAVSEHIDNDVVCNRNEVPLAFDHHKIMGGLSSLSSTFLSPRKFYLAIKLAALLPEDTTSGGFGSGLLLRTSHV